MGRFYAEMLARYGYGAEVAAVQEGWKTGPDTARDLVSDAMLDDTAIIGTTDEVRAKLAAWHSLEVDEPLISMPPGTPDQAGAVLEALIR
jgi:alkanesulfonate monooxygenase SsuD/methylene tetrahydromethanopterin reductase-like flavin-dependent oxidoreductase (luciferase family)